MIHSPDLASTVTGYCVSCVQNTPRTWLWWFPIVDTKSGIPSYTYTLFSVHVTAISASMVSWITLALQNIQFNQCTIYIESHTHTHTHIYTHKSQIQIICYFSTNNSHLILLFEIIKIIFKMLLNKNDYFCQCIIFVYN